MFYTYAHYTPQGRLFYIGKGTGRRATAEVSRNQHWRSVVQKYGKPEVQILANWKTNEEACSHEILLIECFRDMGHKLCNLASGGNSNSGWKMPEEQKKKISLKLKGREGKKPSAETLIKLRDSHLGQRAWSKGLTNLPKQSPETIAKRVAKLLGHTYNTKFKFVGTNKNTGETCELVGNSMMKNAGFDPARIRNCADGVRKTHKKYTWVKEPLESTK
jgi:hypothetical protein